MDLKKNNKKTIYAKHKIVTQPQWCKILDLNTKIFDLDAEIEEKSENLALLENLVANASERDEFYMPGPFI